MKEPSSDVRSISDTALWVAYFRARETQRPDALFRDVFAQRLAGEHGFRIANTLADENKHEWAWVARTYLFDQFIARAIRDGSDMVVNLAAGLDARPYRMDLPSSMTSYSSKWILSHSTWYKFCRSRHYRQGGQGCTRQASCFQLPLNDAESPGSKLCHPSSSSALTRRGKHGREY
jgi:hypothetical protein